MVVIKKILLAVVTAVIVFILTTSTYLLISKHSFQFLSPLSTSHFSLYNPPGDSLTGNIATLSGKILWQSRIATEGAQITSVRKLQQGEEISTGDDGKITIEFPGVGIANLEKDTDIAIIQTLPADLILQEKNGTAIFSKTNSNIPLSVRALDLLVNAQLGKFSINVDKDKSLVEVSVEEGSINLAYTDNQNVTQIISLSNGKGVIFNNKTKRVY